MSVTVADVADTELDDEALARFLSPDPTTQEGKWARRGVWDYLSDRLPAVQMNWLRKFEELTGYEPLGMEGMAVFPGRFIESACESLDFYHAFYNEGLNMGFTREQMSGVNENFCLLINTLAEIWSHLP